MQVATGVLKRWTCGDIDYIPDNNIQLLAVTWQRIQTISSSAAACRPKCRNSVGKWLLRLHCSPDSSNLISSFDILTYVYMCKCSPLGQPLTSTAYINHKICQQTAADCVRLTASVSAHNNNALKKRLVQICAVDETFSDINYCHAWLISRLEFCTNDGRVAHNGLNALTCAEAHWGRAGAVFGEELDNNIDEQFFCKCLVSTESIVIIRPIRPF